MTATPSILSLLPEIVPAALRHAVTPLRVRWRQSWFYRRLLRGPLADHIVFHPHDSLPRHLEDADALLRGRFRFAGQTLDVTAGSVFDAAPPSRDWQEALESFDWLPSLSAAGGEGARSLATALIREWMARNPRYREPGWLPQTVARRLVNIFAHGRLVLANSDMLWRSKLFVALRRQARLLERISEEAPEGLPRLEAAAALALSGVCMDDSPSRLEAGLTRLDSEIARQILPDGGHVSRSPEALLHAYRHLAMVMDALAAVNIQPPHTLLNARDRMAPMLRFFRHGDGALALFQGGHESDARMITGLLARDDTKGAPFTHARHSGYQRLAAARSVLLLDCGTVPPPAFSTEAHAGFLAIELSSGPHRLVVNCGAAAQKGWSDALRATAAHSTLTLGDRSSAQILPPGLASEFLGPRLTGGPRNPTSRRSETAQGWTVEASHDGYAPEFGLRHERKVTLAPHGLMLTGADRLAAIDPKAGAGRAAFALRFHIHPDVRVSRLEGGGILLKLPNGEGWRFRFGGGELAVEESVYWAGQTMRRGEQLVIAGLVKDGLADIAWVFEQIVN